MLDQLERTALTMKIESVKENESVILKEGLTKVLLASPLFPSVQRLSLQVLMRARSACASAALASLEQEAETTQSQRQKTAVRATPSAV